MSTDLRADIGNLITAVEKSIQTCHVGIAAAERAGAAGQTAGDGCRKLLRTLLEQRGKLERLLENLPRGRGAADPAQSDIPRQPNLPGVE